MPNQHTKRKEKEAALAAIAAQDAEAAAQEPQVSPDPAIPSLENQPDPPAASSLEAQEAANPVAEQERLDQLATQNADLAAKLAEADRRFLALQKQHLAGNLAAPEVTASMVARIQDLETALAKNQVIQDMARNPKRKPSPEEIAVRRDPQVLCTVQNLESPHCEVNINMGGVQFDIKEGEEKLLPLCVMDTLASIRRPNIFYDEDAPAGQQIVKQGWIYRFSVNAVSPDQLADARRIQRENDPDAKPVSVEKMKAAPPVQLPGEASPY